MEHLEIFCQIGLLLAAIGWGMVAAVAVAAVALIGMLMYSMKKRKGPAVLPPPFMPPFGELLVANMGAHSILGFERGLNGQVNANAGRVISGTATGLNNPIDISLEEGGRIWVLNLGVPPGNDPSITVYEPNANGNATPVFNLPFGPPGTGATVVTGAIDRRSNSQNFFVSFSNDDSVDELNVMNDHRNVVETIAGPNTQFINPTGVASFGNRLFVAVSGLPMIFGLYVVDAGAESAILIFEIQANGTWGSAPASTISGNATGLINPAHICSGAGNLFVLNRGSFGPVNNMSITVYDLAQTGNVAPIRKIGGPDTHLTQSFNPYGIAVDFNGWIYVSGESSILVFSPDAEGNVQPNRIINSSSLSNPIGLETR